MSEIILSSHEGVTLLGAGPLNVPTFHEALNVAPTLVAADGGAQSAIRHGVIPKAVIGDFDSIEAQAREAIPEAAQYPIAEQDSTDFEKCLSRIEAPLILGVGFTGGRIDHELAVYNTLTRYPDKRCVLIGEQDVICLAPSRIVLDLEIGTRVSLFPLGDVSGRSTGLRWPIDTLEFAPNGQIGTSNEACEAQVVLEMDAPNMLLILPREALGTLMSALR